MERNPKVSICVPVYNTEKYLSFFIDSALQQNFDDYEIVLADNHSTDSSWEIMNKYQEAFPDKIIAVQTSEHGGAGKGRNTALQNSRGEYIYWCDADDLIHPDAIETLYSDAVKYDADIVCGYGICVDEKDGEIKNVSDFRRERTRSVNNETLINASSFFWMRLIKRSLIEECGLMPENIIMEDIRYLALLNSYANRARFLEQPVYYWYKRGNSTTSVVRKELCEDILLALKEALVAGNSRYVESIQYWITSVARSDLELYWPFYDLFIEWIREQAEWFYENEFIKKDESLFKFLRWAEDLSKIQCPNRIYVDGFTETPTKERLEELKEKVFHDECEIVILSEETCKLDENIYIQRAYNNGNLATVVAYFALKKIYENGGMFIHKGIKVLSHFSYLKYQNAFFSLLNKKTYSEWIYGAPAGHEVIFALLETYSDMWDKQGKYYSLSERISIILMAKYGVPQDGKARLFQEMVSVIPIDLSVADTRYGNEKKKCAFEHDFSAYAGEEGYITIPRSSLRDLLSVSADIAREATKKSMPVNKNMKGKTQREKELEKELDELYESNLWKLMQRIKKVGDGPCGPFLKKVFNIMLKIRAKFKK